MKFGVHVSIAGGIHQGLLRAVELGCNTAQFFLVNPRSWKSNPLTDMEIERFLQVRDQEAKQIRPLVAHMPYLPNLASQKEDIFYRSVGVLQDHLMRCEALNVDYLVLHMGKGEANPGIERMREGIVRGYADRLYSVVLLLENTAGQGSEIGSKVSELSMLYDKIPDSISQGICLDTCHAYAAGYDIGKKTALKGMMKDIDKTIGFSQVKLIHLNDSLKPLGSHVDRHAQIGQGCIGKEGFRSFFSIQKIRSLPCILEVPQLTPKDDVLQLQLVRSLLEKRRKCQISC